MPQGFSFEGDIAPMRGSFFKSGLSSREGSYLAKKYGPDTKDMKDMLTIQSQLASIRNSDLRYEATLADLKNSKDKAARERDLESRIPNLVSQINDINDAEGDSGSKAKALTELQLKNPYLANSGLGSSIIGTAYKSLELQEKERIKIENKEKEERGKYMSRLKPYAESGGVDEVTAMIDADGVRTEDEQSALDFAQYARRSGQDKISQQAGAKARTDFIAKNNAIVKSAFSALDSLSYTGDDKGGLAFDPETQQFMMKEPSDTGGPSVLKPQSRKKLERIYARITKQSLKDVRELKLADDDLQDELYDAAYAMEMDIENSQFKPIRQQSNENQTSPPPTNTQWDLE